MIYIENIFVCIAIPMLLSLFFTEHRQRVFTLFVVAGMAICLLAAYVSSFFMKTGILNFRGSGFFFALQKGAKVFLKSFSLSYITSRNRIS